MFVNFCQLTVLLFTCMLILVPTNANTNNGNIIYKLIETASGPVRGQSHITMFEGKEYYAFKGIRYAKPPLGQLRFKAPQPSEPWTEVPNANEYGNSCVQLKKKLDDHVKGHEDCLFLNIFVPVVNDEQKLAVMFYIHGGGYSEGSGDGLRYNPDFLMNEQVILVTINYRLGVFGFLSLGSPDYSGNMGMKDQQLALKWINDNVEQFGGDKNRITIFGHSSGSACTHFHVLSPTSRGLFSRAIMMSGTALNVWAFTSRSPEDYLWSMFVFARNIGRPVYTYDELIELLKVVPASDLAEHLSVEMYNPSGPERRVDILWAPIKEKKSELNAFLIQTPEEILKNFESNVDTMIGFASAEMLFLLHREIHNPDLLKDFNEKFQLQLPFKNNKLHYDSEEYKSLAEDIRNFYFGEDIDIDNETIIEYNDLLSDIWMVYDIDRSAKLQAVKSTGKTFYYRFSVDSKYNQFKMMFNISLPGSSHGDELCYLFRCRINATLYDNVDKESVEYRMLRQITKMWTNFAKYGEPAPNNDPVEFRPIEKDTINFVEIHNEGLIPALSPHQKYIRFWNDLCQKHESLSTKTVNTNKGDEL